MITCYLFDEIRHYYYNNIVMYIGPIEVCKALIIYKLIN